jgi:acetylornithine/N-succinyldiaminopimelate aminotransferase
VGEHTCAVMLEPIQGEGGVYVAYQKYLQGVKELCEQQDLLLVLDEVQTGMGRTGALFACEHYGIEPDIMTVSKGLGSGLPIGAILAKERVAAAFQPGDHGTTFGGGPVPCAAALATLDVLEKEGLIANAAEVGGYFKNALEDIQQASDLVVEVRGTGLMLALQLNQDVAPAIAQSALERGFVINHIGPNILRFLPPLLVTTGEVDQLLQVLKELL